MRIIEEAQLKDFITKVDNYSARFPVPETFFANLNRLGAVSLQDFSYEKDNAFFDEVSNIVNVISSIISHPHLTNKREETIVRVEQAKNLQADAFKQVLRDSKLWKQYGLDMIPEEVHYFQHVDELKIYENCFIVLLINLIDAEITKYTSFYVSLIPSVNTVDTIKGKLDTKDVGVVLNKLERLRKKLSFIKATYFYKVISRGLNIERNIKPTNILLKDRLYRSCFRFYRKFVRYEDPVAMVKDLRKYYFILLLSSLKEYGFKVLSRKTDVLTGDVKITLTSRGFSLKILFEDTDLVLKIRKKTLPKTEIVHILKFDGKDEGITVTAKNAETTEAISIWNLYYSDCGGKKVFDDPMPERDMIAAWIGTKIKTLAGDSDVYSKFCPVCRSRNIESEGEVFTCNSCTSKYVFVGEKKNEIWFLRLRRK